MPGATRCVGECVYSSRSMLSPPSQFPRHMLPRSVFHHVSCFCPCWSLIHCTESIIVSHPSISRPSTHPSAQLSIHPSIHRWHSAGRILNVPNVDFPVLGLLIKVWLFTPTWTTNSQTMAYGMPHWRFYFTQESNICWYHQQFLFLGFLRDIPE